MFTLAVSCLTTSNLQFMDLAFQVPMQYCSLQHRTLFPSLVTSTTGRVFALALSFHTFWSYFSTLLQWHIGHLLTWEVHLSMSYLFAFPYSSWGLKARILKWFAILFSSGPHFVRTLHYLAINSYVVSIVYMCVSEFLTGFQVMLLV